MDTKRIITKLQITYYAFYVLAVALYLCFAKLFKMGFEPLLPNSVRGMILQYVVIFYTIIAVAGGLWLFKKYLDKIRTLPNKEHTWQLYQRAALIQILAVGIGMLLGLLAYYWLGIYTPMLWCGGICAIALIFCKPTRLRIQEELFFNNEE